MKMKIQKRILEFTSLSELVLLCVYLYLIVSNQTISPLCLLDVLLEIQKLYADLDLESFAIFSQFVLHSISNTDIALLGFKQIKYFYNLLFEVYKLKIICKFKFSVQYFKSSFLLNTRLSSEVAKI